MYTERQIKLIGDITRLLCDLSPTLCERQAMGLLPQMCDIAERMGNGREFDRILSWLQDEDVVIELPQQRKEG